MTTSPSSRDRGTTLIEVLVVTLVMGIVAAVLTVSFVAIVRTTPGTEARTDDARTLLGVTTYLPEDVNSTPPNGFDFANNAVAAGCLAAAGPTTENLVQMAWDELSTVYRAAYRYEAATPGAERKIVRYECTDPSGAVSRQVLTSKLPAAFGSATVVPVTDASSRDIGLELEVTTIDGKVLTVNSRSNDPDTTLPAVPPVVYPPAPPGNSAPNASPVSTNTAPGVARDVQLAGTDPDFDALTAGVSGEPPLWTVTVSGLVATITPDAAATVGSSATFDYTVVDPFGQTDTSTITVDVLAVPTNTAPTAGDVTDTMTAGTPYFLELPMTDPESDPLTVTWAGVHPSLTITVSGTVMTIQSDGSEPNPGPFTYTADDGTFSDTGQIDMTVIVCSVSSLVASEADDQIERRNGNKRLVADVTYTVTYTGPCNDLVLEYDHNLDDASYDPAYLSFPSGSPAAVTVDGHPGGLTPWSLGFHTMTLRRGISGPVVTTRQLEVIPE